MRTIGLSLLISCSPQLGLTDADLDIDSGSGVDTAADTAAPDSPAPPEQGPALYTDDRVLSPVTPWVAAAWKAWVSEQGQPDVFMKLGASSTVSRNTLYCFAEPAETALGEFVDLADTLTFFRGGDAAGTTPFDRVTQAALSGRTASWAISGDPSPVEQEVNAIRPRYAIIHYGTNDMGMGSTYDSAMPSFYDSMMTLLDVLEEEHILPILTGISPRNDSASADRWAETYNALIRGMAQARQLPFIDLHLATWDLSDHGLSGDGLHLEAYSGGACVLTDAGLEHGYNVRNLIVLQALDAMNAILNRQEAPPEAAAPMLQGAGSAAEPFAIEQLPFADTRNTRDSPHAALDVYTGCNYEADESGPEWTYTLNLTEPTPLRAVVLDQGEVDIDIHILDETGTEEGCLLRSDRTIETTLPAGTWTFVLDSYVNSEVRSGEYLFVVQPCESSDDACR